MRVPLVRPPGGLALATLAIVAVTAATVVGQHLAPSLLTTLGASRPEIWHGQVWRLVTGTLVHGLGPAQLAVNMAALLVFGPQLERALGAWRFAAGYFVAGGLAWLAMLAITDPAFVGAGASPAVFAVMAAGVPAGLRPGGDRRWAALSGAAVAAGLALGLAVVPLFGVDVLYAHLYGAAIGLLGGGLLTGRTGMRGLASR